MATEKTRTERAAPNAKPVGTLTYVLCYEDLLARHTRSFALDPNRPLVLGRALAEGDAPHYDGDRLTVGDAWMSNRHAVIAKTDGVDVLLDGGSKNGTFVHGKPVRKHVLEDGDLIEVGHSLFSYRISYSRVAQEMIRPSVTASPHVAGVMTHCPDLIALLLEIEVVAALRVPVLLLGEPGTGKRTLARAIHRAGGAGALQEIDGRWGNGVIKDVELSVTDCESAESAPAQNATWMVTNLDQATDEVKESLARAMARDEARVAGRPRIHWIATATHWRDPPEEGLKRSLDGSFLDYCRHLMPLRQRREDLGTFAALALREDGATTASITQRAARECFNGALRGNIPSFCRRMQIARRLAGSGPIDVTHLRLGDHDSSKPPVASSARRLGARIFISFADADRALCDRLLVHLGELQRTGEVDTWHEGMLGPGESRQRSIADALDRADVVLFLVTADFLASDYLNDTQVVRALARSLAGTARAVPILARPCGVESTAIFGLEPLPRNRRPISQWSDRDSAWVDVVTGIRRICAELSASTQGRAG